MRGGVRDFVTAHLGHRDAILVVGETGNLKKDTCPMPRLVLSVNVRFWHTKCGAARAR
jgi:hypothetical protein